MDIFLPIIKGKTKKYYDIQSYKYIRRYAEELYKINTMHKNIHVKTHRRLQCIAEEDVDLEDIFISKKIDMAVHDKRYDILLRYKNDGVLSYDINWTAMFNGDLVICKYYLFGISYFSSCAKNPSIVQLSIIKYKTRLNQTSESALDYYPLIKSYKSRYTDNIYLRSYYKYNN